VAKLVLLSVVIMMFAIPLMGGRERNGFRAIRKVLVLAFLFNMFYYLALRFIYPHLV
jgi:hypothetical protein